MYTFERCLKHNVTRLAGAECWKCARERWSVDRFAAIVETLHIHSGRMDENFDLLMALEARIADQDRVLIDLARRLGEAEALINRLTERSAE
jgi:hypothetical protein